MQFAKSFTTVNFPKMGNIDKERDEQLRIFFKERIVPLADKMRRDGSNAIETELDPNASSYFVHRESGEDYIYQIDRDSIERELQQLWQVSPVPGLAELATEIVDLAESMQDDTEISDEVSPFIYAMF